MIALKSPLMVAILFATSNTYAEHPDAPLMDHVYRIVKIKDNGGEFFEPPKTCTMKFRGGLKKGWIEMNTCYWSHSQYEVDWSGNISFSDTMSLSTYYTFCELTEEIKSFEEHFALILPKMISYVLNGDDLTFYARDGSQIELKRHGKMLDRLQNV